MGRRSGRTAGGAEQSASRRPSNDAWSKNASRDSKASNWPIAEPRLRGRSQEKIAADYGITRGTVHYHLRKMGFPPGERAEFCFTVNPLLDSTCLDSSRTGSLSTIPAAPSAPAFSLKPRERLTVEQAAAMLGVSRFLGPRAHQGS